MFRRATTGAATDDHLAPGDGIIDWPRVQSKLGDINYQGASVLEFAGDGDVRESIARAARRARETLAVS